MDIKVYGTLHAATGEGIVARAAQIKDAKLGMTQEDINQKMNNIKFGVSNETLLLGGE